MNNNNLNEVYREILKDEGLTQEIAGQMLGYKHPQNTIARKLSYGIGYDGVAELVEKVGGYRIVLEKVMPNGKVRKQYILMGKGKEKCV